MRPTIRQLVVFRTVAEQTSFRKSAELLHTSQPALSNTVKDLEAILGTSLFNRTTRIVKLTEAGNELYARTVHLLDDVDMAIRATQDVASGRGGTINITYVDFAILGVLPEVLNNYRAINPHIQVSVSFARTMEQLEMLHEKKVDVGFILDVEIPPQFQKRLVSVEGLVAVIPRSHRLANRESIELIELADESFITGDIRWQHYTDPIINLCIQRGFVPKVSQRAYLRDELLMLVLSGLGVLIYPECIVNAPRYGLSVVPISDVPKLSRTAAVWRRDNTNPVLSAFIDQVPEINDDSQ